MRALGATSCELATPGDVMPATAGAVADAVGRAGVRVTAVASLSKPNLPGGEADGLQLLEDSIRCAEALGARFAIAYFGAHPERAAAEAIARYAELTRPCLELAGDLGVTVLIENHFSHALGDVTSAPEGCAELIGAVGSTSLGLNFDPCNFAIAGIDLSAAYAHLRQVVRNVHVKDARPFDPERDAAYPGRIVEDVTVGASCSCRPARGSPTTRRSSTRSRATATTARLPSRPIRRRRRSTTSSPGGCASAGSWARRASWRSRARSPSWPVRRRNAGQAGRAR